MSGPRRLAVILAGRHVADVERTRAGVLRLTYRRDARGPVDTPLSLSLPPIERSIAGARVESYLWGLLPDDDRALAAMARRHGADGRNPLSLLAAVGKDCPGAVQFCLPEEVEATTDRDGGLVPVSEADIEMRLAELRTNDDAGWTMPGEHWSLGGSQQKFALRRIDDQWFEAQGSAPTSHILKPGIHRMKTQALLEHVSMRAAAACDIDVAFTEYTGFKSESAIVVTRFDRVTASDGRDLVRLHQEDACQALGVGEKYEDRGGPSADDVIRLLRDASATAAQANVNVERFVDGLVFNTVIAAPDAHARNYAVLLDRDDVRLAPLFDVASGLAYHPTGEGRMLSMSIAGAFDADAVSGDAWRRFADRNRLDPATLLERVRRFADLIPAAMRATLDAVDDWDGAATELRRRLLPTVDEHLAAATKRL